MLVTTFATTSQKMTVLCLIIVYNLYFNAKTKIIYAFVS